MRSQSSFNIVLVCAFVDMLSIGLAIPVLPVLIGELVPGLTEQVSWFGILTAIFGLMQFLCMPLLGALSDKIGRRPVLLVSMAGSAINFFTTAWAPSLGALFIGRIIGGMSAASVSVISAYVADQSDQNNRTKKFGQISAAMGLGFLCGPFLGGLFASVSIRLPFILAGALSLLNFALGYFLLAESLQVHQRKTGLIGLNPFPLLLRVLRRSDIRPALIAFLLNSLTTLILQTTWVLYTVFRFNWTPRDNGFALLILGLTGAIGQIALLGALSKRLGERRLAILGLSSASFVSVLFGIANRDWMLFAIMPFNLLAFLVGPALQAEISKATQEGNQGEVMGALQSFGALGFVLAPLVGTNILGYATQFGNDSWKAGASFFFCALVQLSGCAFLVLRRR